MVSAAMTTVTPLRLLILGAPELVHAGLRTLLHPRCVCACDVDDPNAHVDVVVLDGQDRASAERALAVAQQFSAPILALLPEWDVQGPEWALHAGVVESVSYAVGRDELLAAVSRAANAPAQVGDGPGAGACRVNRPGGLSEREAEVLGLVACGLSNQEICGQLYLSINTVKTYVRTAYRKIGVKSRSQAVAWCIQHGLSARPLLTENNPPG